MNLISLQRLNNLEMWARMQFERWSNEAAGNEEIQERSDKENNVDNVKEIGNAKEEEDLKSPQKKENPPATESVIQNHTKDIRSC